MEQLHPDVDHIVLTEEDIHDIVTRLGSEISRDYAGKNPLVVCVLKGAFVFTSDLLRAITVPCEVDFMAVSSYGSGVKTSGVAKTIGGDIVMSPDLINEMVIISGLIGAIIWNIVTWWFGMPSSSSHALIGGMIGAVVISAARRICSFTSFTSFSTFSCSSSHTVSKSSFI